MLASKELRLLRRELSPSPSPCMPQRVCVACAQAYVSSISSTPQGISSWDFYDWMQSYTSLRLNRTATQQGGATSSDEVGLRKGSNQPL